MSLKTEIEVTGDNVLDVRNRKKAIETLQANASTAALEFMAELSTKKDSSKKLLSKKILIKTFF